MNKRQKKKKGLLIIEKTYSNWGNKKKKSIEQKEVKEKEVTEEKKIEETPAVEEVTEDNNTKNK